MPPGSRVEIISTESGLDRISALPETSILARGWRHHWKFMHSLRIKGTEGDLENHDYRVMWLKNLVDRVLLNRHVPLEEYHVRVDGCNEVDDVDVDRWIRHAVSKCHVGVLLVDIDIVYGYKTILSGNPIVSEYLKRLEIHNVKVEEEILDLSCCTALEDLRLSYCEISATKISCQSVKRLMIASCTFHWSNCRTCISAPNTISLKLDNNNDTTPFLECMPLLQTAFVRLVYFYDSYCPKTDSFFINYGICKDCSASEDQNDGYMLLGGLSSATHLELIAPIVKFTDWRCPTFDKLKTLLLNEWCVAINLGTLLTILQHSPSLEKLTLQINEGPKQTMLKDESNHTEQPPAISKHLNVVEIKCTEVNERVYKIIKLLSTFDLQINIMRTSRSTDCFSFERWNFGY